ncbi:HalX domain-containing protein [Halopenitus persicus]|uniref:HalX domain-containing protein n=2 Tax=Halopenitus persicus TaxID=1048396 RepID=A0A1H3FKP9_9EURY|nr:HalX domain-containing protein [Halopenitus persicus]
MTDSVDAPTGGVASDTTVLIVEDEADLADTYSVWLRQDDYDVETAYGGDEALAALDPRIDVVVLDRRMPNIPGDAVLRKARERDGSYQISMLTAVEPDENVLDLPFDEYLTKPIDRSTMVETVECLAHRRTLDEELQELFRLASKHSALEPRDGEVIEQARRQLQERIERKKAAIGDRMDELEDPVEQFAVVENPESPRF